VNMATVAGVEVATDHYIGGERVPSPDTFQTLSPLDGKVLAEVARGGAREVRLAVTAATDAFEGWAALGAVGRAAHLHPHADQIDGNLA
jgi:aminomuconate-semialdehyde/2-hydroxymuconate-6-semialdehyde dehydrogenase